jgi:predicted nuclease of restriction endonuclease-like (RecB) superfamily
MSNIDKVRDSEFNKIASLIEESRNRAFRKVNSELVLLYYNIGQIVSNKVVNGTWGDGTVEELAGFLKQRLYGLNGFDRRGLYRMKQFYETYNDKSECFINWNYLQTKFMSPLATQLENNEYQRVEFVSPMATQIDRPDAKHKAFITKLLSKISWTNHLEILSGSKSSEEKIYYLILSEKENWTKLELRRQIKSAAFERSMIGEQKVAKRSEKIPQIIVKDPYIFEFLDIPDIHSESDLEKALVINLHKFILEIGKSFTYMGRQYRLQVGNKDYYTDLLFYHRELQCLVLFELKIQEFEPEFLGKLNFYLEALDRDVKRPHEKPSIGILLCKGKDIEVVEYAMARNNSPALIADYETKLIDKKLLARKLHQLVEQLSDS